MDGESLHTSADFREIVENLHEGFYFTDLNRRIIFWNKAAERITGFRADEVLGKSCQDNILIHVDSVGNSLCMGLCPLAASLSDGMPREMAVYLHHKSGHRIPVLVRVNPLRNAEGIITGAIELFTDLSPEEFLWDKIQTYQRLALLDPLTELPNRRYLDQQVRSQLAQLERYRLPFGVLSFTLVNPQDFVIRYGMTTFEKALTVIAQTLRHNLRPYDVVGRYDHDEFHGIFPNVDANYLALIGIRLLALIQNSVVDDDHGNRCVFEVHACMDIAQMGDSVVSLLERLDHTPLRV